MPKATGTLLLENDRLRVTLWSFAPAADTGWHRHTLDYIVVPLTSGRLRLELPGGGEALSDLTIGAPYFRKAGVEHNVINVNNFDFTFIEIELHDAVSPTAQQKSSVL